MVRERLPSRSGMSLASRLTTLARLSMRLSALRGIVGRALVELPGR
jgi:hypothetical protein